LDKVLTRTHTRDVEVRASVARRGAGPLGCSHLEQTEDPMSYPPPPNDPDDSDSTPPPPPPPPPYGNPPPPAYAPPPPPGYAYPAGGAYAVPAGNKKALWSMILGIVSLVCCGVVTGIIAIVLSQQAKQEIAASGGMQTGAGQAQAGFVLGIIGIALSVIGIIAFAGTGSFN
jgi:hypothetical protein